MKFEVSERISTSADKTAILKMLTDQFRKVSQNIVLSDEKLSVHSIEASWGSINRTDTTVITLKPIDGGFLIVADVHYRPSIMFWVFFVVFIFTYVAWVVPIIFYLVQKNTVRQAIVNVFKRVADEFTNSSIVKNTVIEQLERLATLKDKGILTDEEFQGKKAEILNKKESIIPPVSTLETIKQIEPIPDVKVEQVLPKKSAKIKITLKKVGLLGGVKGIGVMLNDQSLHTMNFGETYHLEVVPGYYRLNLILHGIFSRPSNDLIFSIQENQNLSILGEYSKAWGYIKVSKEK